MNDVIKALGKSLEAGFIDQDLHSNKDYLPELLVNDKSAGKKILTTIKRELDGCDEFWFSVAFVTTSGVATLIETFSELESKGIKGKLLVSQYLNFTQPEALKRLLKFNNIELKIAVDGNFHSKGYLFKKAELYDLIVGSSNLTANALCLNKEWNLKVSATLSSYIIGNAIEEFSNEFNRAIPVTDDFISSYEEHYTNQSKYNKLTKEKIDISNEKEIVPNNMQQEALSNIEKLRQNGKTKALLISATGTGKTYLSAFDAKDFNPNRFLFVVHRANIAKAAMDTYGNVFGASKSMGMYSGDRREINKDFIFSTIQTISRENHLKHFEPDRFDYIVIDETHRAGAASYQRILDHFKPKFLLGMTATPERTDGWDIFKLFDHTIAYEIRLHKALDEDMLSPFHYYGVTDISVDGEVLEDNADFSLLTSDERINHIIKKAEFYGCDDGDVRGLIFCSGIEECKNISDEFNSRGYKTVALTGENSEEERAAAIDRLESNNLSDKLDYIFTVDIFNEGIDIPRVNQVVMLRPTQSAIIFVQQLGRGLRKADNKEYLTVIDFIGNYSNNYLVPIALYGDTSYNKDSLRKFMSSGSSLIPGASTINFDKISHDRIYDAIDSANMQLRRDLVKDYQLLKYKLGRIPMMVDFIDHGSRDPQLYVNHSKSYFNFVVGQEASLHGKLDVDEIKLLDVFSGEINNSKRLEECLILRELVNNSVADLNNIKKLVLDNYGYIVSDETINSCINNLKFEFVTDRLNGKFVSIREKFGIDNIIRNNNKIYCGESLKKALDNSLFIEYLLDNIDYSIKTYNHLFSRERFCNGFVLYRKYSRKDVFRILNWEQNPNAQTVGGYKVSTDKTNCPIFVNYHKEENITGTTKYEDEFINNAELQWMSKSRRTLNSPDVKAIRDHVDLRLPLFIKKSNDEGKEFYYMGDITPTDNGFEPTTMPDDNGNEISVVKIIFAMNHPVEDSLYDYLTSSNE